MKTRPIPMRDPYELRVLEGGGEGSVGRRGRCCGGGRPPRLLLPKRRVFLVDDDVLLAGSADRQVRRAGTYRRALGDARPTGLLLPSGSLRAVHCPARKTSTAPTRRSARFIRRARQYADPGQQIKVAHSGFNVGLISAHSTDDAFTGEHLDCRISRELQLFLASDKPCIGVCPNAAGFHRPTILIASDGRTPRDHFVLHLSRTDRKISDDHRVTGCPRRTNESCS